jgi:hypothetical protein
MTEAEFRAELAHHGVEPYVAEWVPGHFNPEHAHDFTARGFVIRGSFTLSHSGAEHPLPAGADFRLAAGILHTERAGPAGATVLAGRLPAAS